MKHFTIWKTALAGLLLITLLAGCGTPAGSGVSPSPDTSPASAEETQAPPEETSAQLPLPQEELTQAALWLNLPGNCELFWSGFSTAEEANIAELFYSGAGVSTSELTEEEFKVLEEFGFALEWDVAKVPAERALRLIKDRLGLDWDLEQLKERLSPDQGWCYLEEYDAFYNNHNDTMATNVFCEKGARGDDGCLEIECTSSETGDARFIVRLMPQENDYRILSIEQAAD